MNARHNYYMPNDQDLEQAVQDFILDVCEVMHRRGYASAPVGAIMRLIGVPESKAREHDNTEFLLGEDFERMIQARRQPVPRRAPTGITLH
jgi:hypothetical protein